MCCTIKPKSPSRQPLECMGASREGIVASPQSVGASCSGTRVIAHRWSVQGERAFRWYRRKRVFSHLSTGPSASFRPSRATAVLMDADNGSVDHLDGAFASGSPVSGQENGHYFSFDLGWSLSRVSCIACSAAGASSLAPSLAPHAAAHSSSGMMRLTNAFPSSLKP